MSVTVYKHMVVGDQSHKGQQSHEGQWPTREGVCVQSLFSGLWEQAEKEGKERRGQEKSRATSSKEGQEEQEQTGEEEGDPLASAEGGLGVSLKGTGHLGDREGQQNNNNESPVEWLQMLSDDGIGMDEDCFLAESGGIKEAWHAWFFPLRRTSRCSSCALVFS